MSAEPNIKMIDVLVTSSINSFGTQRRFPTDIKIRELKQKLELLTGASPATMELQLRDKDKKLIANLTEDDAVLGSFPMTDTMTLHVVDSFLQTGEFEDVSKVEKFVLSDEEYSKRNETFRAFKDKLKLEENEEQKMKEKADREKKLKEEEELMEKMTVGNRCEVQVAGKPNRRGTVMYIGKTDFKPGFWVGVKYDEPLGKNNGSVKGKMYFECQPNYGSFVKPHDVNIGDFPEVTYDLDEI